MLKIILDFCGLHIPLGRFYTAKLFVKKANLLLQSSTLVQSQLRRMEYMHHLEIYGPPSQPSTFHDYHYNLIFKRTQHLNSLQTPMAQVFVLKWVKNPAGCLLNICHLSEITPSACLYSTSSQKDVESFLKSILVLEKESS